MKMKEKIKTKIKKIEVKIAVKIIVENKVVMIIFIIQMKKNLYLFIKFVKV